MKKLLTFAAGTLLLTACSSTTTNPDLFAPNGGWNENVDITALEATSFTKKMQRTDADVVYFNLNEAILTSDAKSDLTEQADWLKDNEKALVVIEGRCDERGTREYNLALGEKRANAARSYLIAKGVDANRIRTISYGKDKPVVLGSDEEAWSKNRSATTVAY